MNQKTTIIIAVAVVAIVAVAGVSAFFLLNKDKNTDDEYYYYLYFGADNAKNGWYSAKASNASDGFTNAMKDANLSWEKSKWGYIASIDGNKGYNDAGWCISVYTYAHTDKAAQDGSSTTYLNGWQSFSGYDSTEHDGFKFYQSASKIWFLTPYIEGYGSENPNTVSTWKNSGPFEKDIVDDGKKEYSFYLYFAADNAKNGWYSAKASNASDAFTDAMKDANIEWTKSGWGYVASIDGNKGYNDAGWCISCYTYSQVDKAAQDGSSTTYLNGWQSFSGYDSTEHDGFKFFESASTIWFLTPYIEGYGSENPNTVSTWKASGPFTA
ncbi:MAG: hypothetical protein II855_07610 [Candidatus Methanomethylophilaceae archaeon]|nr:hypothetical protein [Candidatus Methanomethylophilaceae archaeon]